MLNFFLQEQPKVTPKVKKIIKKQIAIPKKYQAFHLDCAITKDKICYCPNNAVLNVEMNDKIKTEIWKKYQNADHFYRKTQDEEVKVAKDQYQKAKAKIQCLSRKEVASFVKSIKKERNLMGEVIQY